MYLLGALVALWQSVGFAIGRLQVRISAWATSHSAFHPFGVGSCGWEGRQVWLIPIADERVGVQVKL